MKSAKILNIIAACLTLLMGIGHVFVPFFLPWQEHTQSLYEPIVWALYAMNFFFSILLAWGGFLSLIAFYNKRFRKWINGGMAAFWLIGGVYEILFPFPVAEVKWLLPVIALLISLLYIVALGMQSKDQQPESV